MKRLTPLIFGLVMISVPAMGQRHVRYEKYISALVTAPVLVTYADDGAADITLTSMGANRRARSVRAILKLGSRAIPLLISHLGDTRTTAARFRGSSARVPVGFVCLDILMNIVKAPRVMVADCADDGLGACVRSGYYFRPDAYMHRRGKTYVLPVVKLAKRNWQKARRNGYLGYHHPD